MTHKILSIIALVILFQTVYSQKRPMSIDDLKTWNTIKEQQISSSGKFVSYQISPHKGDPALYLYSANNKNLKTFERGYGSTLGYDNNLLIYKIKVQADTLRQKKLDKVKKDKLPKDSLGIYIFDKDTIIKVEKIEQYIIPDKSSKWLAYLYDFKEEEKKDTAKAESDTLSVKTKEVEEKNDEKDKKKEYKQDGKRLVILNTNNLETFTFDNVSEIVCSERGENFTFIVNKKDSIDTTFVYEFDTKIKKEKEIFVKEGKSVALTLDKKGFQTAFLFSSDTINKKKYTLFYKKQGLKPKLVVDTISEVFKKDWGVSEHKTPFFTDEGNLLYFGVAKLPRPEPKDTLLDDEKVKVDVWNWKDKRLQPMQLVNLKKDLKKTYLSVYQINDNKLIQLEDSLVKVYAGRKTEPEYYLGQAALPYYEMTSWDMHYYSDYYRIDAKTGERKLIGKKKAWQVYLSPKGKHLLYWSPDKENWFIYNLKTLNSFCLTENVDDIFKNDEQDTPSPQRSFYYAGWDENEDFVYLNSKYDLWRFSTKDESIATNLTQGTGRQNETRHRFVKLERENVYVPSDKWLVHTFNRKTLAEGYKELNLKNLKLTTLIERDRAFSRPKKAEEGKTIIWTQESYKEFPDLRISDLSFKNQEKISDANQQQDNINWGTIELTYWNDFRGDTLRGMLFKPENFDKNKKYPVIIYFYEKYSERYHTYWTPNPSRSIVNFPFYVSNDYIVFVPDVNYTVGLPGKDAYNAIVSGATHIANLPFVNRTKIGIQGQSWGGYQVAYLVTQTNMFACAMGGAVVSNMTSAYGGIRWGSGMSRMFQYEQTQSRIGGSLWEKRDKYIENSPVFFADRVETPILLMHNDGDGAVPWYQGIEYFVALRRLQKPVWMLNYNGDNHNLRQWPNRVDLTHRMFGFFEHYLKGKPMPLWMEKGIPATQKGKVFGY